MLAIFGLGSNVEPRREHLRAAVAALSAMGPARASRLYESVALLPPGAPPEWDMPYLNMALAVELPKTEPQALLSYTQALEASLGRVRRGHWGPREIDIDILALGDIVLPTLALTLPHAELLKRDFALLPLAEVAPEWRWPVPGLHFGETAAKLVRELDYASHAGLRVYD